MRGLESGARSRNLECVVWSLECVVGVWSAWSESGVRGRSLECVVWSCDLVFVVGVEFVVWRAWFWDAAPFSAPFCETENRKTPPRNFTMHCAPGLPKNEDTIRPHVRGDVSA